MRFLVAVVIYIYIGRTMRPLHHRLKEHADSIDACLKKTKLKEEGNFYALAHHIFENPSHSIKFDQAQLIAIAPQLLKQKIREALEIAKINQPSIKTMVSFTLAKFGNLSTTN